MTETRIILRHPDKSSAAAIKLSEGTNVVGRDPTCNIVLSDHSVSRFHAELSVHGSIITVRDLNSRNGTYVDGKHIQSSAVRAGQQLHFGCVKLHVVTAGANASESDADPETRSVSDVFESAPTVFDKVPLSPAERRVFDLILSGHAEKEVAHRLEISRHTVHSHVRKIYEVIGVRSRAELLARFVPRPNESGPRPNVATQSSPDR
jgi:DNA-binding CsgD family transcriptional regulator